MTTSTEPLPSGEHRNADGSSASWRNTLLHPGTTVQDAIRNLNETGLQITMVVDDDGMLRGTVTDGDIRRGLLRGIDLAEPVDSIMFREPLVVTTQLGRESVLHLMQANKIHSVPIIDEHRYVVGLHVWDALLAPAPRSNVLVVMAGGQGRRLRPHTENCPKPMLPVGGKPILEHIVEHARAAGFSRIVVATHYLGHMIEDYFGTGAKWDVEITYLREPAPLGTCGALGLMAERPLEPFVVTNGDVLADINYADLLAFHIHHRASATMAVRQHEWQHPFGVVRTEGVDIVGFEEKPITRTHINAGVYVLDPSSIDFLRGGDPCNMPTLFKRLQDSGKRTIVYPIHEPWLDVGHPDDLARAHDHQAAR